MTDINNPRIMWLKLWLFVSLGLLAVVIALVLFPSIRLAVLMLIAIWAFCRAYYFAFYVIEHYVDSEYRFAGLIDFAKYALKKDK